MNNLSGMMVSRAVCDPHTLVGRVSAASDTRRVVPNKTTLSEAAFCRLRQEQGSETLFEKKV